MPTPSTKRSLQGHAGSAAELTFAARRGPHGLPVRRPPDGRGGLGELLGMAGGDLAARGLAGKPGGQAGRDYGE
jgi:hypothetical protein